MGVYKPGESYDDVFTHSTNFRLTFNYLIFGNYSSASSEVGVRFRNVTVPQGATITTAYVTFNAHSTEIIDQYSTTVNVTIKGEDADDAALFSDLTDFSGRTRTSESVSWSSIPSWVWESDNNTPSLVSIIQEIVDRPGWSSGSDLVLFFADNSSSADAARAASSYDYNTTVDCAALTINYSGEPEPSESESPSASPSLSPSASESPSESPSLSPSASASPSLSPSLSPSASESPSESPSPSVTGSVSPSPSLSPSASESPSMSPSLSPSASASPSSSPSLSPSASASPSASPSLSPSASVSPSASPTPSASVSPSRSPSVSPSVSPSLSPSISPSASPSASPSTPVEGTFEMPIATMTGESKREGFSSGQFDWPIFKLFDIGEYVSRGEFVWPLLVMEGWARVIPVTGVYKGIAMNLFNQAMSTYSNYPFNSLAYFNGKYLGATDWGMYKLEGRLDNGAYILSKIKTGPMDFGTKMTKHIRDVWMTYRSDGHLALIFSVDEDNSTEVERTTEVASNELREEKIKVPRGLKGRYYTLEFKNVSGADFDLDKLEVMVDILTGKKR